MPSPLVTAFAVSLLIHVLAIASGMLNLATPPATPPGNRSAQLLQATLQQPSMPASAPDFILPAPDISPKMGNATPRLKTSEKAPHPAVDRKKPAKTWTEAIRQQFSEQQNTGLFYPDEAIRLGLEGEALVRLMLDEQGNVLAARIEESSGHALLDQAAVQAVRRLRTLPSDAPSESLLPVRFRLN